MFRRNALVGRASQEHHGGITNAALPKKIEGLLQNTILQQSLFILSIFLHPLGGTVL